MKISHQKDDEPIQFVDLAAQRARLGDAIEVAISKVISHQQFIMGPEISQLEHLLAKFSGAKHAITCSSGTDALALLLLGFGIKPGDVVICPTFTFCATAEVIAWFGAIPLFVDVDLNTFNINPTDVQNAIDTAQNNGHKVTGIVSVDLFGRPADYKALEKLAKDNGKWLLCDAAQSFGASYNNRNVGTFGIATATSFFPAKPLGCYGDGGAIFTDDDKLASLVKSLRSHGKGEHKYDNIHIGMAARMDTIQAAILIEKISIFPEEIEKRRRIAEKYNNYFSNLTNVIPPSYHEGSTWAQYTIQVDPQKREAIQKTLRQEGIPTQIYYPIPLHRQKAYRSYPTLRKELPVSDQLAASVISLPIHPYISSKQQEYICQTIKKIVC
ncbi:DegT/DnrJ/EryC1/StrS family aminotransferase [Thalassospira xiamenensis]|uniref:DegT/DnrJ/EryC1/StrS family aminotransferase n=1 Tax=Thalassospira xiamenensis TaxID=220697 RepID=UPI000DEDCF71|nr:DegT/DnrJ/EryC1/StrS family aminotransferase [Thalassospira xiamenensis]RCK33552.1 aminotransferase DegT [Thalassospira xiamenensis]